jgi:catechol 2,3-dioxygenase-like lactoylglutathione lyase family enzyme
MNCKTKSIRPFIGAKNFDLSRAFYRDLGFKETVLSKNMAVFQMEEMSFYLQDAYVKDWIDNSMIFLEVEDVNHFWNELLELDLTTKYKEAKVVPIKVLEWGKECFIHDPSGVLWHVGEFNK